MDKVKCYTDTDDSRKPLMSDIAAVLDLTYPYRGAEWNEDPEHARHPGSLLSQIRCGTFVNEGSGYDASLLFNNTAAAAT